MKLHVKLSKTQFVISQLLILIIGLIALGIMYYLLNNQYQKPKKPFLDGPVTTIPKSLNLNIEEPEENSLIFSDTIIVSGKTAPLKGVLIYTDTQDAVVESKKDGSFSYELNLDEGRNKITIVAFDANGNSRTEERTIYYSKEKI